MVAAEQIATPGKRRLDEDQVAAPRLRLAWSADRSARLGPVAPSPSPAWHRGLKRTVDLALSMFLLLVTLPIVAVAALAIKLDSPGPVVFRQHRAGWKGRTFTILKLRTMAGDAEDQVEAVMHQNDHDGPQLKITDDPRVTRVGRVLRSLSIDELPQLWNVIRGDMSLVGPRPAPLYEAYQWPAEAHRRLAVRPGLTGLWQVSGRSDLSFDEYIRCDLDYVDGSGPMVDLIILAKTVPVVLTRHGAH